MQDWDKEIRNETREMRDLGREMRNERRQILTITVVNGETTILKVELEKL
jgi:hypothetical protein